MKTLDKLTNQCFSSMCYYYLPGIIYKVFTFISISGLVNTYFIIITIFTEDFVCGSIGGKGG